jgi:5-methylcytosine-specific restriction enzyme A
MSKIPKEARWLVHRRQRGLCFRCMMPGAEWHHRRGRSVVDDHTHCPCNGVLLCATCHRWVHLHPTRAEEAGLIVSRACKEPWDRALHGFDGWWGFDCKGQAHALSGTQH